MTRMSRILVFFLLVLPLSAGAAIEIDPGELENFNNPFECSDIGRIVDLFFNVCGPAGAATAGELIQGIINLLLAIASLLAVLFIIIGGIRYITAHGNEEQAEGAKKTLLHAVIGIVLIIMSFAIINIIANSLVGG